MSKFAAKMAMRRKVYPKTELQSRFEAFVSSLDGEYTIHQLHRRYLELNSDVLTTAVYGKYEFEDKIQEACGFYDKEPRCDDFTYHFFDTK